MSTTRGPYGQGRVRESFSVSLPQGGLEQFDRQITIIQKARPELTSRSDVIRTIIREKARLVLIEMAANGELFSERGTG